MGRRGTAKGLRVQKIREGMAKAKQSGRVTGKLPYGWDRGTDGKLVPNAQEQVTIQRIKNWKARGKSAEYMARLLNKDGLPSKSGGKWYPSSVRSIVLTSRNPKPGEVSLGGVGRVDSDPQATRKARKRLTERLRRAVLSGDFERVVSAEAALGAFHKGRQEDKPSTRPQPTPLSGPVAEWLARRPPNEPPDA